MQQYPNDNEFQVKNVIITSIHDISPCHYEFQQNY